MGRNLLLRELTDQQEKQIEPEHNHDKPMTKIPDKKYIKFAIFYN